LKKQLLWLLGLVLIACILSACATSPVDQAHKRPTTTVRAKAALTNEDFSSLTAFGEAREFVGKQVELVGTVPQEPTYVDVDRYGRVWEIEVDTNPDHPGDPWVSVFVAPERNVKPDEEYRVRGVVRTVVVYSNQWVDEIKRPLIVASSVERL